MPTFGKRVFEDEIKNLEVILSWIGAGPKSSDICHDKKKAEDDRTDTKEAATMETALEGRVCQLRGAKECHSLEARRETWKPPQSF